MDYRALVQKLGDRTNQNSQTSELILEHRTGHPTYLNNDMLMMFAEAIAHNIWIFQVSRNADFYTSDFPIVVKPHVLNVRPIVYGVSSIWW